MTRTSKILAFYLLLFTVVLSLAVVYSPSVFLQLFIAFALAYILNPAVGFLEVKGLSRVPGILIVFFITSASVILFGMFLLVSIGREFSSMQLNFPAYAQQLYELIPYQLKTYLGIETPDNFTRVVNNLYQQARVAAPDLVKPLLQFIQKLFSSSIAFALALLGYAIIPVYLFYLLADLPQLKTFVTSFIPDRFREIFHEKLNEVDTVLSGFIRGQLLVCAILAVLYSIGLYLIGIDLAVAIGMLAGATFIIPYVGTVIGIVLSMLMALLKFHDLLHPLLCLGWFALVQGLEGIIITPKIVGDTVGLHPLVALIALLLGGQLFGIMGMLLAIPLTAVIQVFLRSLAVYYRNSDFYHGDGV